MLVRKTVTALFCDLTDSTGLGEHLDPETHRRVITRYFDEMRAIIERHGGTVEKFIGDAVMALFGIPQVREDDALRAVRAAAEMRDRIAELGDELQALHGVRLDVSIGVNTGEVVAGGETVGGTLATGDAINVAARLQQAAGPGEILIGKATYPLVSNAITAGPLQRFKVKGKREEVSTWRLETVDAGASGFARRLDTPIVDREYELRELLQAFDRVTEEGACRLVTVLGPAGIGKSRLFGELLSVLDERASALTGRCLPYGDGITFWPLAQMVRALGGPQQLDVVLRDARDATAIADRVRGAIGAGPPGGAPEETFWAVRRLFEELARRRPLVVCVEDVHWAEPTFLDLLEYLVGWTREAPVLLVCLARPDLLEARASWLTPQPNTTVLSLEPLSETDADALVETLGGSAPLSKAARERIARAAEGNPLFVEQMVALAAEDGDGGDGAGGVPPSIQALLGERLDRLPAGERAVVERAAVAGREFFREAVVELSPAELRPSVTSALLALVRKGLVSPDVGSEEGEDGFRFRHALIRDAAYGALPREERAELHERFADWVERTMPARAVELEEIVGYHLEQAHAARAALAYDDEHTRALAARGAARLRAAGMRASARGDVSAAVTLLTRATVLLRDDDAARVELAPELAYALSETGELQQAGSVLDQALETARTLGNRCVEARTLVERSYLQLHTEPSAWPEALPTAERAIDLLESVGDDAGLARAWTLVVLVHYVRGRVSQLEVAAARALEHGRRADDRRAVSTVLNALVRAALIGPLPVAEAIDRCERLAAEVPGDRTLEAVAASARSNLEAMRGRFDEARRLYSEALATLEDLGLVRMLAAMRAYSAETELYAGDAAAAERELRAGIRTLEEIGDRGNLATHEALLARVLLEQGKADDAREATLSSERMASAEDIFSQVDWRGTRARLLAREGDVAAASVLAEEAVAIAAETDHVDMQGLALSALADVLAARGDTARAAETLAAAVARFETKGNEVWAAAARRRLADLSV